VTELNTDRPTTKRRRTPPFYCWVCLELIAGLDQHYLIRREGILRICCGPCIGRHVTDYRQYRRIGNRAKAAAEAARHGISRNDIMRVLGE
jgi:hypothetical protein